MKINLQGMAPGNAPHRQFPPFERDDTSAKKFGLLRHFPVVAFNQQKVSYPPKRVLNHIKPYIHPTKATCLMKYLLATCLICLLLGSCISQRTPCGTKYKLAKEVKFK